VWDQILNSQAPIHETADLDLEEWQDSNFFDPTNENAEDWAQQSLVQPTEPDFPSTSTALPVEVLSLDDEPHVCYGMVGTSQSFRRLILTISDI
jgi:hypothetical protein